MIREILWPIRANEFDGVEEFRERRAMLGFDGESGNLHFMNVILEDCY